ncbi:MAG: hypothetical protein KKI08_25895, partial [Armatimonadetes bacterium]|nr:hypothetical protein [Armatimonadota bacterium]
LVPVAAAVVMLGCLAARIWLVWGAAVTDVYYLYRPTHLRADSLFCGVAIAYIYHFHPDRFAAVARHRKLLLIVGTLLLVPTSLLGIHSRAVLTLGFTALYLGYACWLVVVVTSPLHSGRVGRFLAGRLGRLLARIGFYSYSIYLWHFCLRWPYSVAVREAQQRLAGVPLEATWLLFVALYAVASVAVGIVAALVVEGPFLRLRDRVAPSRSAALPPPQESGETAAG